jgi:PST family polysaccharide transporter/lipopolysaccharide exporter
VAEATYPVFLALGKPHFCFYLSASKLVLIATLIYPLTLRYGIVGAAVSITIPAVLEQVFLYVLAASVLESSVGKIVTVFWRPAAASIVMTLAVLLLKLLLADVSVVALLFSSIGVGALVYLGSIAVLDRGLLSDSREQVRNLLGVAS